MTTYRVCRGIGLNSHVLKLGDRVLERGSEFDASEFPEFDQADFDRWASHRLIENVSTQQDERRKAERRQARAMQRARAELGVEARPPGDYGFTGQSKPADDVPASCPDCDHIAKNEHGLKVHRGRKH